MHWLPDVVLAAFALGVFLPNMGKMDASISRYPGFAAYRERSGLLLRGVAGLSRLSSPAPPRSGRKGWGGRRVGRCRFRSASSARTSRLRPGRSAP